MILKLIRKSIVPRLEKEEIEGSLEKGLGVVAGGQSGIKEGIIIHSYVDEFGDGAFGR